MGGETNLNALLACMSAELQGGVFVFVTVPGVQLPENFNPLMQFQEAEGATFILHSMFSIRLRRMPHEQQGT